MRPPTKYTAIITTQPPAGHKQVHVLTAPNGVAAGAPPHFSIIYGDQEHTLQGYHGLFYAVLLFLLRIKERDGGLLNGLALGSPALRLAPVLAPVRDFW